jgi:glycyl-tRNA synthetase beta chain
MPDLLIELLSEEIPARMQAKAAEDLKRLVTGGMVDRGLTYAHAAAFATPRRLALAVEGVAAGTPALREERRGPRVDAPEKAIEGFLRSAGVAREALRVQEDKKGAVYLAVIERPGRAAAEVVAEVLAEVVRGFPWPKSMRWGSGALRWVRPLHSIVCVMSDEAGASVVPVEIDGIAAGDVTRGHRFMAPEPFAVTGFEDYRARLKRAFVILDGAERAEKIAHDAEQLAFARGLEVVRDDGLLAEVAGLVEWPVVLTGRIEERFLALPPEVLQVAMKVHQKFLSVRAPSGRIEGYVVVANRETADGGATVLAGNARVLAARLADAEYFWRNDLATGLDAMRAKLEAVTFHAKLGTQGERIARIAALAREIAPAVGADPDLAARAAEVAKADLASEMVYEFPELQGVMGRYYALEAGEAPEVAAASEAHYAPLGPSDAVPEAPVSVAVALADKIDMLTGFWVIQDTGEVTAPEPDPNRGLGVTGYQPTGSKDPYALRRAALGILRTVLEKKIRAPLRQFVQAAYAQHQKRIERQGNLYVFAQEGEDKLFYVREYSVVWPDAYHRKFDLVLVATSDNPAAVAIAANKREPFERAPVTAHANLRGRVERELLAFFADRLKVHLRDQGIRHDVIDACFGLGAQDDLVLLVARVRALQDFLTTEDGANLLVGYRRAVSILGQEERRDGVSYELDPHPSLAETEAERGLFTALDAAEVALEPALAAEDFRGAMTALARLRGPIDAFFDTTTVNAENAMVRRNRLCLLHRIRTVMNRVAVFSALEGG